MKNQRVQLAVRLRSTKRIKVKDAYEPLIAEESDNLVDDEALARDAVALAENDGIVFLDEIDKIARGAERGGADVSREGVQRDLLPLIEGATVATKHGPVKTDHILFIASGAFHLSKPSDLLPELQGRLPIRVELDADRLVAARPRDDVAVTVRVSDRPLVVQQRIERLGQLVEIDCLVDHAPHVVAQVVLGQQVLGGP